MLLPISSLMATERGIFDGTEVGRAGREGPAPGQVRAKPVGWELKQTRHLEIQFPSSQAGSAHELSQVGDGLLEEVIQVLGIQPSQRYVVRLAPDRETFNRVQPARPPVWAAGTAWSDYGLMVLLNDRRIPLTGRDRLETTFTHESVHLLLGEGFGARAVPRWLNEGAARLVAREYSLEEWATLSQAVLLGRLISVNELEKDFPNGAARAELAYAQSRELLNYLTIRFGDDLLPRLIRQLRTGTTLNEALWAETRHGLVALEQDWQDSLHSNFAWISALSGGATLWGLGGILLGLGYLRKRRQRQARRAQWDAEEALIYGPEAPKPVKPMIPVQLSVLLGLQKESPSEDGLRPASEARNLQDGGAPTEPPGPPTPDPPEEEEAEEDWLPARFSRPRPLDPDAPQEQEEPDDRPPPGGWLH